MVVPVRIQPLTARRAREVLNTCWVGSGEINSMASDFSKLITFPHEILTTEPGILVSGFRVPQKGPRTRVCLACRRTPPGTRSPLRSFITLYSDILFYIAMLLMFWHAKWCFSTNLFSKLVIFSRSVLLLFLPASPVLLNTSYNLIPFTSNWFFTVHCYTTLFNSLLRNVSIQIVKIKPCYGSRGTPGRPDPSLETLPKECRKFKPNRFAIRLPLIIDHLRGTTKLFSSIIPCIILIIYM